MEFIFLTIPYVLLRLLNYSPSGLWLLRAESSREKNCGPSGWSGNQEISSHQAVAPTKPLPRAPAEILNRAPGNSSTLDDLLLPGFLVPIVKSDRVVHNPPPQHRRTGTIPDPPSWNASESAQHRPQMPSCHPQHQRRHPRGGNGLKSTLRDFSNGLSLRRSRSRGSLPHLQSLRQSAAEPDGRRLEVKKHR